jgi:hypothetical protein
LHSMNSSHKPVLGTSDLSFYTSITGLATLALVLILDLTGNWTPWRMPEYSWTTVPVEFPGWGPLAGHAAVREPDGKAVHHPKCPCTVAGPRDFGGRLLDD